MAPKRDRYAALLDTQEFRRTVKHQTQANRATLPSASLFQNSLSDASTSVHPPSSSQDPSYWESLFRRGTQHNSNWFGSMLKDKYPSSAPHLPEAPEESLDQYGLAVMATAVLDSEQDISTRPHAVDDELLASVVEDLHKQAASSNCRLLSPELTNLDRELFVIGAWVAIIW